MSDEAVVFELTANTREVSLPNGKVLKPGDKHKTADPAEIALLKATKGLKEADSGKSSSSSSSSKSTTGGKS